MSRLAFKKLLIGVIATIITLTSGITLATALYNTREKNAPQAAVPAGVPSDAISITEAFGDINYNNLPADFLDHVFTYRNTTNFYITTSKELNIFRAIVNAGKISGSSIAGIPPMTEVYQHTETTDFSGKTIYLANDIDLGGEEWIPIGRQTAGVIHGAEGKNPIYFKGTFEGLYHTISNFVINDTDGNGNKKDFVGTYATIGFFGNVQGAKISGLRLSNETINVKGSYDGYWSGRNNVWVGGLVGKIFDNNVNELTAISRCTIKDLRIYNNAHEQTTDDFEHGDPAAVSTGGFIGGAFSPNAERGGSISYCSIDGTIETNIVRDDDNAQLWTGWIIGGASGLNNGFVSTFNHFEVGNCVAYDTYDSDVKIRGVENSHDCVLITDGKNIDDHLNDTRSAVSKITKSTYKTLTSDAKLKCFTDLRNLQTNNRTISITNVLYEGENVSSSFYLPRTNEFNNGVPLPIGFMYNNNSLKTGENESIPSRLLQLKITGVGTVDFIDLHDNKNGKLPNTTFTNSTNNTSLYLPYEPFEGSNYAEGFNKASWEEWNESGDSATLYGYTVAATPNVTDGWFLDSMKLITDNSNGVGTADRPYRLEVTFTKQDTRSRDITVWFGGFLMIDGSYDNNKTTTVDGVEGISGRIIKRNTSLDKGHISSQFRTEGDPYFYQNNNTNLGVGLSVNAIRIQNGQLQCRLDNNPNWDSNNYAKICGIDSGIIPTNVKLAYTTEVQKKNIYYDYYDEAGNCFKNLSNVSLSNYDKSDYEEITAYTGETNHGFDEEVFLWVIVETRQVTIATSSKDTNAIGRQAGIVNGLNSGTVNKGIGLLNVIAGPDMKDPTNFQLPDILTCAWYSFSLDRNYSIFQDDAVNHIGSNYLSKFNTCYNEFMLGNLYIPTELDEGGRYPILKVVDDFSNWPGAQTPREQFAIRPGKGYTSDGWTKEVRDTDQKFIDITIKLAPIEYEFYLYAQKNSGFDYLKQTYTVESAYKFLESSTGIWHSGMAYSFNSWGLLVSINGVDVNTIWNKYGYTLTKNNTPKQDINGQQYLVYTLSSLTSDEQIQFSLAYPLSVDTIMFDKTCSYAKILDVNLSNGGGGILQYKNANGSTDGEIVSAGSIKQMGSSANMANTSVPCILGFGQKDNTAKVRIKNVEYRVGDGDTFEKTFVNEGNQIKAFGYGFADDGEDLNKDKVRKDIVFETSVAAGQKYNAAYEIGAVYHSFYYRLYLNYKTDNEMRFYPYIFDENGDLKNTDEQKYKNFDHIFYLEIYLTIYDAAGNKEQSGKMMNGTSFEAGKTYEFTFVVRLKRVNLNFYGYLKNGDKWTKTDNLLYVSDKSNSISLNDFGFYFGSTVKCDGAEYVGGVQNEQNKFYRIKITAHNLYEKLGYNLKDISYEIIYAPYFSTAEKVTVDKTKYTQIFVINKGGFGLFEDRLGYRVHSYNLQTNSDLPNFTGVDITIDYRQYEFGYDSVKFFDFVFGLQAKEFSIPLYYENNEESSTYTTHTLNFNATEGKNLSSIIQTLGLGDAVASWGITSNKDVLKKSGFTHIAYMQSGEISGIQAIDSLTQQQIDELFQNALAEQEGQRAIMLLRNSHLEYTGSGYTSLNFTNALDYERWVFSLGNLLETPLNTGENVQYYQVNDLLVGSYGNLRAGQEGKDTLNIGVDDPYLKLINTTYKLKINVSRFLYKGEEFEISNAEHQSKQFKLQSVSDKAEYQLVDDVWLKYVEENGKATPYLIISGIEKGQLLQFDAETGILSLSGGKNSFELLVYLPIDNSDGNILFNLSNKETIDKYYNEPTYKLTDDSGNVLNSGEASFANLNITLGENDLISATSLNLTLILQPKIYAQNFTTASMGYVGEKQYDSTSNATSLVVNNVFGGSKLKIQAKQVGSKLFNSQLNKTLTYYTLTYSLPSHLKALYLVERLGLGETTIYIIPQLMTQTDAASYYIYPAHGYALDVGRSAGATPIIAYELEDYSGATTSVQTTDDSLIDIFNNTYYKVAYKLLSYYVPLYYRGVGENVSNYYQAIANNSQNKYTVQNGKSFDEFAYLFGNADFSGGFDWALTSNATILLRQGFTHILMSGENGDEIVDLQSILSQGKQAELDEQFANAKQIVLYRQLYATIEGVEGDYAYDYQKIIFNLTGSSSERGEVKYYNVYGIEKGSYLGDLQAEHLDATVEEISNYPYLYAIYKEFDFMLFTDKFANPMLNSNQYVDVKTVNQYQNIQNSNWIGYNNDNTIYSLTGIIQGQTLTFNGTSLSLDSAVLAGFTFKIAVPLDNSLGGINGYIYLDNPILSTYYSKLTWLINENLTQFVSYEFDLDSSTQRSFAYTIQGNTTIRLVLTPREVNQNLNLAAEIDGSYRLGVGARILSDNQDQNNITLLENNNVSSLNCNVFAGSSLKFNKNGSSDSYYSIRITAPSYLADLVAALNRVAKREYTIQVLQHISTNASGDYLVYPTHGYKLKDGSSSPLKYNIGNELDTNSLTNFNVNSSLQLTDNITYLMAYEVVKSSIPLYYYDASRDVTNYSSTLINFDVNSANVDMANYKIAGLENISGWILSTSVNELKNQQFTHILNENDEIETINSQQRILDIFANKHRITLYRSNGMANKYDYDAWTFELGLSLCTKNATYFLVNQLIAQASYGVLPVITISANSSNLIGPYLRPVTLKDYKLTIDNLAYDSEKLQNTSIHLNDADNLSTYFGIGSEGFLEVNPDLVENEFGQGYTATAIIKNTLSFNYPFFNSFMDLPSVFFTKQDFVSNINATSQLEGNFWFVHNYGYQITGWKVIYILDGKAYDLYVSGDDFVEKAHVSGGIENKISSLNYIYLSNIAKYLDEYLADVAKSAEIMLIPCWEAVKIAPTYLNGNKLSSLEFRFGGNYNLSGYEARYTPLGQSLMYYTSASHVENSANGIVLNPITVNGSLETIAWNYRNLPYTDYTYSNGIFNIALVPYYADNIYKIDLKYNELKPYNENGVNKYILTGKNYAFDSSTKYALTEYVYTNKELYTDATFSYTPLAEFRLDKQYLWAETFAENLNTFDANYKQALANSNLPIFRKIYYSGSDIQLGNTNFEGEDYTSISGNLLNSMYIYLANNQNVGDMPAFLTKYYELILWHNQGSTTTGNPIDYAYATDLYEESEHKEDIDENNFILYDIWSYNQTLKDGKYDLSLKPHYFRKYYYLNPQTILTETNQPGEYGYLVVKAEDNLDEGNESINYLAIYLSGDMQFYSFKAELDWRSLIDYTNETAAAASAELIKNLTPVEKIKIYAGCDVSLNVYDQSRDADAATSGHYDEMIGYQWDNLIWYNRDSHENFTSNPNKGYENKLTKEEIDAFKLSTAEVCNIDVCFSKIAYNFAIVLVDPDSGSFTYADNENNSTISYNKLENLTIKVGETNLITYSATLGYEFLENAFVLVKLNGEQTVLATFSSLKNGDRINQSLLLNLTGAWLRENFYGEQADYSIENNNLGEIDINTNKILFNLYAKTYDSSRTADAWLEDVLLTRSWTVGTQVGLDEKIFNRLENNSFGYIYNTKQYAVVSSYSYIAKEPLNNNHLLAKYDFLLNSIPQDKYNITDYLADNLGITPGAIATVKNVYIVIEVRPLLYIDVSVVAADYDTNSTERRITIQNQNTEEKINALEIVLTPSNSSIEQYGINYFTIQGEIRLYTFFNQVNSIPTEKQSFNANRYSDVLFKLNGLSLNDRTFSITENSTLQITFVPKELNLNVEYQLEGCGTELQKLIDSEILTKFEIRADEKLHVNSPVLLEFGVHDDYLISIKRNGYLCTIDNNSVSFTVSDSDYDFGAVNLVVNLYKKPNKNIIVRLQLLDNNQQTLNDDIGTLTLIVGDKTYENTTEVNVIENNKVDAKILLNKGYAYTGKINVRGVTKEFKISNDTINLIEAFRVVKQGNVELYPDAGQYLIYVRKEMVTLELTNNSNQGRYTIFNNSKNSTKTELSGGQTVRITNAYVGSDINFGTVREVDNYELDYFYYIDNSNNQVPVGNYLTLTSDLLNSTTSANNLFIRFGVATKQKYQINLNVRASVIGLENNLRYTTNLQDFVSGKYYSNGTEVEISFFGSDLGKYDITVTLDGATITKDAGYTTCKFTLTKDTTIGVYIEQSKFNLSVNEYHYNSLSDLEKPDFEPVEAEQNLNDLPNTALYNQQVNLNVALEKDNYLLTKVAIKFDDSNTLLVEISNGKLTIKFNGEIVLPDENGFINIPFGEGSYSYLISLSGNNLQINYTTMQDLAIDLHYINIKEISQKQ